MVTLVLEGDVGGTMSVQQVLFFFFFHFQGPAVPANAESAAECDNTYRPQNICLCSQLIRTPPCAPNRNCYLSLQHSLVSDSLFVAPRSLSQELDQLI